MANFQNEREQLLLLENLFKQKQFAAGLAQIEAVLPQFPASFQLKFLHVKFLKELQKIDQALRALLEMYARFGDNLLILKEMADLNFQQKRYPESLLYYNKVLFLDSFNSYAQDRVKQIQGLLEEGVFERLADTQIEMRVDDTKAAAAAKTAPAPEITMEEPIRPTAEAKTAQVPVITFGEPITLVDAAKTASAPEIIVTKPTAPPTAAKTVPVPEITFAEPTEPEVLVEGKPLPDHDRSLNFETESAAELYFKQGLFNESLAIYKKLFEKTGNTDYFLRIKAILLLLSNEKSSQVVARLQRFLELIQQRGSQFV